MAMALADFPEPAVSLTLPSRLSEKAARQAQKQIVVLLDVAGRQVPVANDGPTERLAIVRLSF